MTRKKNKNKKCNGGGGLQATTIDRNDSKTLCTTPFSKRDVLVENLRMEYESSKGGFHLYHEKLKRLEDGYFSLERRSTDSNNDDNTVDCLGNNVSSDNSELVTEIAKLKKLVETMRLDSDKQYNRIKVLEDKIFGGVEPKPSKVSESKEEDVDLFDSDSEEEDDAEKARVRDERLAAYHAKKSKKPVVIAKTSVLLDVKPWSDETDMEAMLKCVKTIEKDGLLWGASKLAPIGYGINKLQVMCVVEDDKVSIDELCEQITEFEDYVQSCDVNSMSKI